MQAIGVINDGDTTDNIHQLLLRAADNMLVEGTTGLV